MGVHCKLCMNCSWSQLIVSFATVIESENKYCYAEPTCTGGHLLGIMETATVMEVKDGA